MILNNTSNDYTILDKDEYDTPLIILHPAIAVVHVYIYTY